MASSAASRERSIAPSTLLSDSGWQGTACTSCAAVYPSMAMLLFSYFETTFTLTIMRVLTPAISFRLMKA